MRIITTFVLLLCVSARAQLIPTNRIYNWHPGVNCGVPGGIPNRTVMFTNIVTAGADSNGVSDASGIINAAIAACPTDEYVYMPAGTFLIANSIVFHGVNNNGGNRVLRGAGMGKTILHVTTTSGVLTAIVIGDAESPRPSASIAVTGGATQGSTNLTMASTASITANRFIRLEQTDPDYVHEDQGGGYAPHSMSCLLWVDSIPNGTTLNLKQAVPANFTNSPTIAVYAASIINFWTGLEDFTLDMTNSTSTYAVFMQETWFSWVKGVEIKSANAHQIAAYTCGGLEVRQCYTHDTRTSGPNHEGVNFADSVCFSLVEDNICVKGGFPQIILGDSKGGCMGDVISYNYIANTDSGSSVAGGALSVNHGPHNAFNLVEGNVAQMFQSDSYFGSSSDNTAFRNWFTGAYPGLDYPIAVNLDRWSYRFNLYGNVLGSNTYSASYDPANINGYANAPVIYRLGYPNMGNAFFSAGLTNPPSTDAQALDLNVGTTILLTNNFDYATAGIVNPYAGTLPASLIYTNGAPSWWGSQRWPAIDPNGTPMAVNIPAQGRYLDIIAPPKFNHGHAIELRVLH
jgi:Pectate lyase superfamily protein